MSNEKVQKVVDAGPKPIQQAEAAWYIEQAGLTFSGPARKAFELGVALSGGTTRQEWVKTDAYRELLAKRREGTGYALDPKAALVKIPEDKPARVSQGEDHPSSIREWAVSHGYTVSERGRISQEVKDAYAAAKATKKPSKAASPQLTAAERRQARKAALVGAKAKDATRPAKTRGTGRSSRTELRPGETAF